MCYQCGYLSTGVRRKDGLFHWYCTIDGVDKGTLFNNMSSCAAYKNNSDADLVIGTDGTNTTYKGICTATTVAMDSVIRD